MTPFALAIIALLYIWGYIAILFDAACHSESWREFWEAAKGGVVLLFGSIVAGVLAWWFW